VIVSQLYTAAGHRLMRSTAASPSTTFAVAGGRALDRGAQSIVTTDLVAAFVVPRRTPRAPSPASSNQAARGGGQRPSSISSTGLGKASPPDGGHGLVPTAAALSRQKAAECLVEPVATSRLMTTATQRAPRDIAALCSDGATTSA